MGGNALKNCKTRRYDRKEYFDLERTVWRVLDTIFPNCPHEAIKAYANKETFGDMDVVISSDNLPANWVNLVQSAFAPHEMVKNGNCLSFEFHELQIDLITHPSSEYRSALNYFAYNDLGNLLGRIADSMGLKYGHDGLSYRYTVGTHCFRVIPITGDLDIILRVLGYSPARYHAGFATLEEIFLFTMSTPFFNEDIYLLENRDNRSRARDEKRKTYTEFLEYVRKYPEQFKQKYPAKADKKEWLPFLFEMIPGFQESYEQCEKDDADHLTYKERFNGTRVSTVTGLTGKALGDFMQHLIAQFEGRWTSFVIDPNVTDYELWTTVSTAFGVYQQKKEEK